MAARSDETELQLLRTITVTIGANGSGQSLPVGPEQSWERWEIEGITTVCNSSQNTTFYVQRQGGSATGEGTYSGNLDSSNTPYRLMAGERLVFQYTNGDSGARGTVTITGRRFLRGRRAY